MSLINGERGKHREDLSREPLRQERLLSGIEISPSSKW